MRPMAGQIDEVKARTEIVDIIGAHVSLKKAGRNFKGLCPFHSEKSSSFMVSPELQIFKCFGCGESGDVFAFLQKYEGMDFSEALKFLADKAGIKLTRVTRSREETDKEALLEANRLAAHFYHYILTKHTEGETARKYVRETRKLTDKTIEAFLIGAAPQSSTALFTTLTKQKGIDPNVLERAGLTVKTDRGYIDRFRGRVIFPITDHRGQIIALAGRILPTEKKDIAKYINSPETPIYHKSRSLFGLSHTKDAIRKAGFAVITEGEVDAISSWQAGVANVVAIKGSAFTNEQLSLVGRFTKRIVIALDSDFAGNAAAIKSISEAQHAGFEVRVASLTPYKDPDEFAQADPVGYKKAIEHPKGVWDFILDVYFAKYPEPDGESKLSLSREVTPILASITDTIAQAHYMKMVSDRLGVPFDAVRSQVLRIPMQEQGVQKVSQQKEDDARERDEERLFVLYLMTGIKEKDLSIFVTPYVQKLVKYVGDTSDITLSDFVAAIPPELQERVSQLALSLGEDGEEVIDKEITSLEERFADQANRAAIQEKARAYDKNALEPGEK